MDLWTVLNSFWIVCSLKISKNSIKTVVFLSPQYLADIEEHLGVTITQIEKDLKVPTNEFDGKVTYGQKRRQIGSGYQVITSSS